MRNIKLYLAAIVVLLPVLCAGQGKFYTAKERFQNYENKITKVVLPGNVVLDKIIQQEVSSLWQVTPYEFCTDAEYEELKKNPRYFFLRLVTLLDSGNRDSGVVCLSLSKGGSGNRQSRDAAAEFIKLPVASSVSRLTPLETACFPAYISIVQQYIRDAAESERIANVGLKSYAFRIRKAKDMKVAFEPLESLQLLQECAPNGAVALVIAPQDAGSKSYYYHMIIGTMDMSLYYFARKKNAPRFTSLEKDLLKKK